MRKISTIIFTFALLSVFTLWPMHSAYALKGFDIGVRGYVWFSSLDGNIQTPPDLSINFDSDLGVGDDDILGIEAFLRWKRHNFIVAYSAPSFSGSNVTNVDFNGINFTGLIDSKLDFDMIDGIYQYDLIKYNPAIASFYLGLLLQVKYVDGFVELSDGTVTEREAFSAPIPMIGVGAGIGILKDIVILEGRVAGLEISGNRAIDGEVLAGVFIFPFCKIFGGYKIFDFKVDEDDIKVDSTIDGPFAGVQVKF